MKNPYKAKLLIKEFPQTKRERDQLCKWLEKVTAQIHVADKDEYSKVCNFSLMK